jgi:hypothetical protein
MISEFHLRGWQRIPEVEIVALVDPVRGRAEGRRAQFAPQARITEHARKIARRIVVFLGARRQRLDDVEVLPLEDFWRNYLVSHAR